MRERFDHVRQSLAGEAQRRHWKPAAWRAPQG